MNKNILVLLPCLFILTSCFEKKDTALPEPTASQKTLNNMATTQSPEKLFKDTVAMFQQTMRECPEKIWPQADWQLFNLLMSKKDGPSMLWHARNNTFEDIPADAIPKSELNEVFNFVNWQNEIILVLSPQSAPHEGLTAEQLFNIGFHESFHHYVQLNNWKLSTAGRGSPYPLSYKPRLYRRRLANYLRGYLENAGANEADLRRAAYWWSKWKTEYPTEVAQSSDHMEGTAKYVELLATAVTDTSCQANEDELLGGFKKALARSNMDHFFNGSRFALDNEGYYIGGIASAILRFVKKDKSWTSKVKTQSPVDLLLKDLTPLENIVADSDIEQKFKTAIDKENARLGASIDPLIQHYTDKNFIRVAFGGESASYSPSGFYTPSVLKDVELVMLGRPLELKGVGWQIKIDSKTVLLENPQPAPCSASFATLVSKNEFKIPTNEEDIAALKAPGFKGTIKGTTKVDDNGYTWFCTISQLSH